MFAPISIDEFVKKHIETNPDENADDLRASLVETVNNKKNGGKCKQCGQAIWAIGTAISGWNGCFTCITGEADCSEDYEIDSVCFR